MSLKDDHRRRIYGNIFDGGYGCGYYDKFKTWGYVIPMSDLKYYMREWNKYDSGERKCCICKEWPSKIYVVMYDILDRRGVSSPFRSGYCCCSEECFNMFLLTRDDNSTVWI